jgi:chemotaxis protein methyltransferase CheR
MSKTIPSETEALEYISREIYERCRIRLDGGKHALVKARLGKRMRHYGFGDLSEYCHFLQTTAREDEFTQVVDALTTNFTNFMREPDHFEFLVNSALPKLLKPADKTFRIWSAACSSGEEPCTIGFFLAERYPVSAGWNWSITASDISTKVLEKARGAIYETERLTSLPREWLPRYFQRGAGAWAGYYRVKRAISERIAFRQINLIEDYSHPQPFEVIFCRNVMIYFDRMTQEQLVNRLCRCLAPNGFIITGHSESLNGLKAPLRCLQPSIYQKI